MAGGAYFNGSQYQHAAIKDGNNFIDLGTLGGNNSYAADISDTGYVVGESQRANGNYANFLWDGDSMRLLQWIPGIGGSNFVFDVNNLGQSVGMSQAANASQYATLWNGVKAYDLNDFLSQDEKDSGWVLTSAYDTNDNGFIVGAALNTIDTERIIREL